MLYVKKKTGYQSLNDIENLCIRYDYDGEQELSFDISPIDNNYSFIDERSKFIYKDNRYRVIKINKRRNIATITAALDMNEWKSVIYQKLHINEKTLSETVRNICPDGWTIENAYAAKKRCSFELTGCTGYEVLQECKKQYGIVYEYHVLQKKIKVIDPLVVQQRGLYMSDELNLDSVEYKSDYSVQANRLYAYGKKFEVVNEDGSETISYVSFASINGGKEYVERKDYISDEVICAFWQSDQYDNPEDLLTAAVEKVDVLAYPEQSWSCNLYDLSRTNEKYRMLDFKLYDKPALLINGNKIVHQIVEYTDYPNSPNKNKVILSTVFKKIQGEIQSVRTDVDKIDTDLKNTENLVNKIQRDVDKNTLLIQDTYRKGDIDIIKETIIQQTEEQLATSVSETNKRIEVIEASKRYYIELTSSNGTAFRNGDINTNLSVKIYSWDDDISAVVSDSAVTWSRVSADATGDKAWSRTGKSIGITSADLAECATFIATWTTFEARISLVNVYDGESGTPGKDGRDGSDGKTTYFHVKYAPVSNPTDVQISETPNKYIGTYVDYTPTDSTIAGAYTWTQFMGDDGTDGIPGKNGSNGQTSYIHIRYSNDAGVTFTANNGKIPGDYMGQYTDFTQTDSTDVKKYVWAKVKGEKGEQGVPGVKGVDGKQLYTWLKYADTPTSGMSDLPTNKAYIGLAYNKESATESSKYADYTWSLVKGEKGDQGVAGVKGTDGKQLYTWIKYANDDKGTGMSDDPTGKLYIGLAYNKTSASESSTAGDYTWALIKGEKGEKGDAGPRGLQGIQGPKGEQGIQGVKGTDGRTTFFHIKYSPVANPTAEQMSETPNVYIGTYVDFTENDSADPAKYTWTRFQGLQGAQGTQGIPGTNGANGKTSYLHIKYSNDGGKTFTGNSGEDVGIYIGTCADYTSADPTTVVAYKWALIKGDKGDQGPQGVQGPKGADGKQLYTWLKYADTPTSGMSDDPSGKKYMGLAYNKTTVTESSSYGDYTWSLVKGDKGDTGVQGPKGADGKPTYTWIKYATSSAGANMSDDSAGKTYIGLAYNKTTATESSTASDYTWSLIKGDKGDKGDTGSTGKGIKSVVNYYLATASVSGVTASTAGWTTTVQSVTASKKYLWNYEVLTYTDNSTSSTAPCIIGAYGDKGQTGSTGATGNGISSILEHYAVSASGTTAPTTWADTVQTMTATNKYLWNYESITYTNGTTKDTQKRVIGVYGDKGQTGAAGAAGVSISKVEVFYYLSTSNTTQSDGSWTTAVPTWAEGKYMWSKTKTTLSNGTTTETPPVCITGAKGSTGSTGAAGVGVKTTTVTYQASTSGTTVPTDTWATAIPAVAANQYLWTRTVITYTNNTTSTAYSIGKIGANGAQGPQGATGAAGKGIKSTAVTYQASTSGTTTPTGTWATVIPTVAANQYLWTRTIITYTDNTTTTSYSIGKMGANGATGPQGATGAAGKGVASITAEYYLSTSKTAQTGGSWGATAPAWSTGKYMWTRSKIVYSNPASTAYTTAICDSSWEAVNDLEEKVNDQINNVVTEITENHNSSIDATKNAILSTVSSDYTLKSEIESITQHFDTQIEQTSTDIEFKFTSTQEMINKLDGKVDVNKQELQKFIRFVDGQIQLGQSDSMFSLTISNERISFKDNGAEVAYISNSTLYITEAKITSSLTIGQIAFIPRSNGNMSLKLVK